MSEIIHIQVGQCGNQIGYSFWDRICSEHQIDPNGKFVGKESFYTDRASVYFNEAKGGRYVPRALLVDLEPGTMESIQGGRFGKLFKPDNVINATNGAGNNWAKGHYTEGAEIVDDIMDVIRREAEATDCLQGFQLVHSLGGGTGSGLGTLITVKLQEEYADRMLCTFSVIPQGTDGVVEPYNATLSLHQLIENCDEVMCIDNQALKNIAQRDLKIKNPSFKELNQLVTQVMSGVTASLRFPGQLNSDLRKLAVNLIPFPRLHFFLIGYAPFLSQTNASYHTSSVNDLVASVFDPRTMMAACDPNKGKYLTASVMLRGNVAAKEVDQAMHRIQTKNSDLFVNWIPNNIKSSICRVGPAEEEAPRAATFLGNSTSIQQLFSRVRSQFQSMFSKNAFVHWFENEGMELEEFSEAEANLSDLINEYLSYETEDGEPASGSDMDEDSSVLEDSSILED